MKTTNTPPEPVRKNVLRLNLLIRAVTVSATRYCHSVTMPLTSVISFSLLMPVSLRICVR